MAHMYRLQCPSTTGRSMYINRKGFTSLNVMAVCGPDLRFYEVATHRTGRVHDARVLRTSSLPDRFVNDNCHSAFIINLNYVSHAC